MEAALRRTRTALAAAILTAGCLLFLLGGTALAGGGSGGLTPGGKSGESSSAQAQLAGVPRSYAKFSGLVSEKTKLSLRVIGAWSLAEGGPKDNPLNIGPGHHFGTVGKGARATAKLLRQPLYRKIKRSSRSSDGRQIKAIANSPWCTGCRGYGKLLRSTYRQVKLKR